VRTAIRKHLGDFVAILVLFVIAVGVGGYILDQQRLRFPLVEEKPKKVEIELADAQAVIPGQGQTVRVAGVKIGDIAKVEIEDGVAVVEADIDAEYKELLTDQASALLRPKTGLKDMFIEVDPGDGEPLPDGGRIQVVNSAPDVDQEEFLAALDADTRDYLKLLVSGAGKGLDGRADDFREVLKRFEPLHRDLARVNTAIAERRRNLARLVHNYSLLVEELGDKDRELTRLVRASNEVFDAFASEDLNISAAVSKLPSTLDQTSTTLVKVDRFSDVLGPALEDLRPAFRELDTANREIIPFVTEATPLVRDQIRPFVREARPYVADLEPAARDLAQATPDLTDTFLELNRFFNMAAYNPKGREAPEDYPANQQRLRDEGYLFWVGWVAQNTVSIFSTADASGPFRRALLGFGCTSFKTLLANDPSGLAPLVIGTTLAGAQAAGVCTETPPTN
jgi:phospholipid/cholesterol/gamma-HCH transport system substrate-binding protein